MEGVSANLIVVTLGRLPKEAARWSRAMFKLISLSPSKVFRCEGIRGSTRLGDLGGFGQRRLLLFFSRSRLN